MEGAAAAGEVDLANAIDLSESEDEELEDIIDDFSIQASIDEVSVHFHRDKIDIYDIYTILSLFP